MRKDNGSARFAEMVLLILSVLSLGLAFLTLVFAISQRDDGMLLRVVPSVVAAAVFYALYVIVSLVRDTNEKMNALWRGREPPPPAEIQRCRHPGCNQPVYSSSTGLCREHFRQAHPEEEETSRESK